MAHRKASTRTPQPQDKPKEGECPDETNIVIFSLEILSLFPNDYFKQIVFFYLLCDIYIYIHVYLSYDQRHITYCVCTILMTI